ncbi:beta-galactosidase [candidate division WOR-3 bacterium]|nr:beta-galactosidase [candidate division WOR-3 bacterium]
MKTAVTMMSVNKGMKEISFFPYGTHIYRVPNLPVQQLKKDMVLLKKLGFNMIKIQESWNHDEPKEGEVDLSDIEELIKEAEKLGLFVYFGVTMEQAPAWLWKKYPGCRPVYNTGEPHNDHTQYLIPGDGKPGPCWDNPKARKSGERFISILAKQKIY